MLNTARTVALLGLVAALLSGCAQPGQLGTPESQPPPAPAAPPAPAPAPPTGPVLVGKGLLEDPATVRTPGPATFSVRTVSLPSGGTTGWHRHPGTEMSIVNAGSVTVLTEDECDPVRYDAGSAVFVPDGEAHLARNDGTVPAELVVTYLLAPDAPDRSDVPPPC